MPNAVSDTHALIWYLQGDARLSPTAASYFRDCVHDGGNIYVPTICAVEMVYLAEKGRIRPDTFATLLAEFATSGTVLKTTPLNLQVVRALQTIARDSVPDMPDRIIAATALSLGLPLISRDAKIRASGLATIW